MADAAIRMDRQYRWQRHIYDLTRLPYLLGRDRLIAELRPTVGLRRSSRSVAEPGAI